MVFRHNWVEENNYTWCLYVVEKKLLQFCFLLILSICCIISNQYFNTLVFMATMYFCVGEWVDGMLLIIGCVFC